ncbi:glycosyl transferase family 2 [filamentous cyanobacterium CCP1]|nr:glycosyl transferase family 2 [filamentous cyanobacterium CCP2]PSB67612.1 glycosyl transferase family 2 [filamentous cyanobacterium CCP1]
MVQTPTVSVVMAVYNAERYVAQAIDSILQQTFTDFELIILNDGSTDGSLRILQQYEKRDHRIRLISRENQGIPRTRNDLLKASQGEFMAVMDSDDVALPDRLSLQVNFLRQHPEVVCVGGAHDLIDHKGRFLTRLHLPTDDEAIQQAVIVGHAPICNPCALIRREALLQVGGYDERLGQAEDLDVWLKLGEIGKLANLSDSVLQYRVHPQSISERAQLFQRQKAREACERAWQRRGITGTFEAIQPWRSVGTRPSQQSFLLQYGWWAFHSQQRTTALIYALKAILTIPWKRNGWNLLACALIKPFPSDQSVHSKNHSNSDHPKSQTEPSKIQSHSVHL